MNASVSSTISLEATKKFYVTWIVSLSIQGFIVVIELYCLTAFIYYFINLQRNFGNQPGGQRRISYKRKVLIALILLAIVIDIIRHVISFPLYLQLLSQKQNHLANVQFCTAGFYVSEILFISGFSTLYIFLWYRQHILYADPVIRNIVPRVVKIFSNSILVLILLNAVSFTVSFVTVAHFEGKSCSMLANIYGINPDQINSNNGTFGSIITIIGYILLILFQGMLLFCFVFVLRRHQKTTSKNINRPRSLQPLIWIYVKAAAVCIITDIITLLITYLVRPIEVLFDVDFFINLMSVVLCFSSWKKMIDPWSLRKKIKTIFCRKTQGDDVQSSNTSNALSIAE